MPFADNQITYHQHMRESPLKTLSLSKTASVIALLALNAWTPMVRAQAVAPAYKYAISVTITAPAGTSAALIAADKSKPVSTKLSPCNGATNPDQLNFTLKYDAGKTTTSGAVTTDSRRDVYVIFHQPEIAINGYFLLKKNALTAAAPFFVASASAAVIPVSSSYIAQADNLGGAQTEVLLGGNIRLETLPTGIWAVTTIIGGSATPVDFDNPATWDARDVATFVLGKPWQGAANMVCL